MKKESCSRKFARVPMDTPVTYTSLPRSFTPSDQAFEALHLEEANYQISKLRDISEGGLMINTTSYLEPGAQVLMKFTLPIENKESEIIAIGKVKHLDFPKDPDLEETVGMGIEFLQLPHKGSRAIAHLIAKHFR